MILPPLRSIFFAFIQRAMMDSLPKNHKESREFFPPTQEIMLRRNKFLLPEKARADIELKAKNRLK